MMLHACHNVHLGGEVFRSVPLAKFHRQACRRIGSALTVAHSGKKDDQTDNFRLLYSEEAPDGSVVALYTSDDDDEDSPTQSKPSKRTQEPQAHDVSTQSGSRSANLAEPAGSQNPSSSSSILSHEANEALQKVEEAVNLGENVPLPIVDSHAPIADSAVSQRAPDVEPGTSKPPEEALEHLTVKALRESCKQAGLSGYSKLKKAELIDLLLKSIEEA